MGNLSRPLTDIVARRELDIKDSRQKVIVELGRPYEKSTGEFACPFRIKSEATVIQREIFGVDGFQALQLALLTISFHLHHDSTLPIGSMYWEGSDIGFADPEVGK